MLAVFNAGGKLITLTPSQVNQGSNKANTIYIVMPLAPTNVLQARFELPNGKFTKTVITPLAPETGYLGFTDQNGNQLYMWQYDIPSALTTYAGTVTAQFTATNEELVTINEQDTREERVLATFSFEFEVVAGVPPIAVEDIDSYQSIIEALQTINITVVHNEEHLQGQINELKDTVETHTSEINDLETEKQDKEDLDLATRNKTVVGAINELFDDFQNVDLEVDIPLKKGSGKDAVEQFQDQEEGVPEGFFNFRGKNANAIAKDPSLNTDIEYGATGDYSVAFGGKCAAQGKRSLAEGTTTIAKGAYSHAEGNNNVTLGANSHAEGKQTTTYGENAHAEGFGAYAEGYVSHAEGLNTHAQGACSHAEGNGCVATNDQSHAEGSGSQASGYSSHAEGENTFATNHGSHAEGRGTHATQRSSHAEGENTYADGICSHAEGLNTHAVGACSHAEGEFTFANGNHSHAGGKNSVADYECDFVHGEGLGATLEHQTVVGKYNDNSNWGNNRPVFMVGNGTSDSDRSNIFEARQDGTIAIIYNGQKYSLQKILEALSAFSAGALLDD